MLWACIDVMKAQNNTFERFQDRMSFTTAQEGQQKFKLAIFCYILNIRILAINDVGTRRKTVNCLVLMFSSTSAGLKLLKNYFYDVVTNLQFEPFVSAGV
jgi:hypothetical protein